MLYSCFKRGDDETWCFSARVTTQPVDSLLSELILRSVGRESRIDPKSWRARATRSGISQSMIGLWCRGARSSRDILYTKYDTHRRYDRRRHTHTRVHTPSVGELAHGEATGTVGTRTHITLHLQLLFENENKTKKKE